MGIVTDIKIEEFNIDENVGLVSKDIMKLSMRVKKNK